MKNELGVFQNQVNMTVNLKAKKERIISFIISINKKKANDKKDLPFTL